MVYFMNDIDEHLSKNASFLQEVTLIIVSNKMPVIVLSVSWSDTATELLSVSKFIIDHKVQAKM